MFLKISELGYPPKLIFQKFVGIQKQSNGIQGRAVNCPINTAAGHLVKVDGGSPRNALSPRRHEAAELFFRIRAIIRKRGRNEIVFLIVSDKVEHNHIFLVGGTAQSAAELLHKHNCTFRAAQHQNLIDLRNIHSLVKNINRSNIFEPIGTHAVREPLNRCFALILSGLTVKRNRRMPCTRESGCSGASFFETARKN